MAGLSVTLADVVAASMCELAHFKARSALHGHVAAVAIVERIDTLWHVGECRFCAMTKDQRITLAKRLAEIPASVQDDFRRLPPAARLARIREAQAVPWWDELTREAPAP